VEYKAVQLLEVEQQLVPVGVVHLIQVLKVVKVEQVVKGPKLSPMNPRI
jgi:hypothetical protein